MEGHIKWIYRAYFNINQLRYLGIPKDAYLLSAIQMLYSHQALVYGPGFFPAIGEAHKMVREHSTCKNI